MTDLLHAFVLPELGVRGAAVRLGEGYRQVRAHQSYPDNVGLWLGEALAAAALLVTGIKFNGRLSLQLQGGNSVRLLYSECTSEGDIRGIARVDAEQPLDTDFAAAIAGANLAITLEPHLGRERYQGVVPMSGISLAETLEGYFDQSEQLPTRILLAADENEVAGLLLQRLPLLGGNLKVVDPDGWNRAEHLLTTVWAQELLATPIDILLHRLFHASPRVDRNPMPLHVRCRCSRLKVAEVLQQLGQTEAIAATVELGQAEVICEFCGKVYRFDRIEIEQMFRNDAIQAPTPGSLQ